jgi:tetratricopeptide (TPR) repeat protein
MVDLNMEAMMHGDFIKKPKKKSKKDRFTQAIEEDIDHYLDTQSFDTTEQDSKLLSPEIKRVKMKAEMLDAIEHSELNQQIELAFNLLLNEGLQVLGKEIYEAMAANLTSAVNVLNTLDLNQEPTKDFQTLLGINDLTMEACVSLAGAKFKEARYDDTLALYLFLCTLAPQNSAYWLITGIAAQNADKNDLALEAFAAAAELDPGHYEAWIFAVQCYLSQGFYSEAATAFEKAKEIVQSQGKTLEQPWKKLFFNIEEVLKTPQR